MRGPHGRAKTLTVSYGKRATPAALEDRIAYAMSLTGRKASLIWREEGVAKGKKLRPEVLFRGTRPA